MWIRGHWTEWDFPFVTTTFILFNILTKHKKTSLWVYSPVRQVEMVYIMFILLPIRQHSHQETIQLLYNIQLTKHFERATLKQRGKNTTNCRCSRIWKPHKAVSWCFRHFTMPVSWCFPIRHFKSRSFWLLGDVCQKTLHDWLVSMEDYRRSLMIGIWQFLWQKPIFEV